MPASNPFRMSTNRNRRPAPAIEASIRYTRLVQAAFLLLTLTAGWISHLASNYLRREQSEVGIVDVSSLVSSVWCHSGSAGEKLCRFRNICYDPRFQEFQFIVSKESIIFGIQNVEQWKNIDLSTVIDHNAFKMKVSLMSAANKVKKRMVHFQDAPTFIIHRFKPDNIMHVIHDDLIPLFFTIESVLDKTAIDAKQFLLAFADGTNISELDKWYNHYSKTPVLKLPFVNDTICFSNAFVGLHKATLWFNYGFKKLPGPYINKYFSVNGIKNFVQFSFNVWKSKPISACSLESKCVKVVVLNRARSRRILNLNTLLKAIEEAHHKAYQGYYLDIVTIDLAEHDPSFILSELRQATLLVGMHGAGMIMSLFLPPMSAIVELFPYAINPDGVSFLKALFQQHDTYPLHYEFWQNKNIGDSVPGTHSDPLMGRISHLSEDEQNKIMSMTEVPTVKCCHNPAYLYYMYHDTYVQDNIVDPVFNALLKTKTYLKDTLLMSKHIFPALPPYVNCSFLGKELLVEWGEVSNSLENQNLWYQITLLNDEMIKVVNVTNGSSRKLSMKLSQPIQSVTLWFQPFNGKYKPGNIKHETCFKRTS